MNRVITQGKTTEQSIGTAAATPLETELLQGSLRYYFSLERLVRACLNRPLRDKDQVLFALMLVGAYQLVHMRIPDHAAINETVGAVSQLKKPWAKGLVNAVLRKIAEGGSSDSSEEGSDERSFELPGWMFERLQSDFPSQSLEAARAVVERAPMTLRVNTRRIAIADYQHRLETAGIQAFPGYFAEQIILAEPVPARALPGYLDGEVSIQDAGAQFAAHLALENTPSRARILDACAAPGGKLFHLAERFPEAECTGLELSEDRLDHIRAEKKRLGHDNVRIVAGDATALDWLTTGDSPTQAANAQFDLILLDAPCSGSGTMRRHPDIKVLRQPADVTASAELQLALLRNLWSLVAEGGSLIYCTCSLFAEENDQVIEAFVQGLADEAADGKANTMIDTPSILDVLTLPIGTATRFGWQLLPLPAAEAPPNRSVDGFYFARMTRQEKAR